MPVEAQTIQYNYIGDGVSVNFPFPSKFINNSDLVIGVDGTVVTAVTITGAGNESGGNVQFTTAPANGSTVVLLRDPPASQLVDFENGSLVLEGVLDTALDKLTMIAQYLLRATQRSIHIPDLDTTTAADSLELPAATSRVNTALTFDANGDMVLTGLDALNGIVAGGITIAKIKVALANEGNYYTVENALDGTPTNAIRIFWMTGGVTAVGDSLYSLIKGALNWTDTQTEALYAAARSITL